MLKNLGQMAGLLSQASKIQDTIKETKAEMANLEMIGRSADGAVEVVVSGDMTVKKIQIKPELLRNEDAEMVGDLVTVAVNNAINEAKKTMEERISAFTGGLNIPGLF